MNIDIRSTNIDLGADIEEHIERSVRRALGACGGDAVRVVVRLTEVVARAGKGDKQCHVIAHLPGRTFIVYNFANDFETAVTRATDHLEEIVTSVIAQRGERRSRARASAN